MGAFHFHSVPCSSLQAVGTLLIHPMLRLGLKNFLLNNKMCDNEEEKKQQYVFTTVCCCPLSHNFAIKTPLSYGKNMHCPFAEYVNFVTSPKNIAIFIAFLISLDKNQVMFYLKLFFLLRKVENVQDCKHYIKTKKNDSPDNQTASKTI